MTKLLQLVLVGLWFLSATAHAGDYTALHGAALEGNKTKVEELVAKGADVNAKGADGTTPLHKAAGNGQKDVVMQLLAMGADIKSEDGKGRIPLHFAAGGTKADCKDIVELLLTGAVDINVRDKYAGWTPLHWAALGGQQSITELLLAKGADVNAKGKDGETPLQRAASDGNRDVVELLLAKGADANTVDRYGNTPYRRAYEFMDRWKYDPSMEIRRQYRSTFEKYRAIVELLEDHIVSQANPRARFAKLTEQMHTEQIKNEPADSTRRLIVKLASRIKPTPAIPEEARRHFVEGSTIVKAGKSPSEQALAAQSFTMALKVAPWWPDAYYNLAVAQELAGQLDDAERSFTLYILSNPGEREQREAQDRIYGLSAKRRLPSVK